MLQLCSYKGWTSHVRVNTDENNEEVANMKNFFKKQYLVACVATVAFLGMQSTIALANEVGNDEKGIEMNLFEETTQENPDKHISKDVLKKENVSQFMISDEEKDLLARLVEAEAKGESYEGKVAIATVVLNRVDSSEFPDTVTDVVYEVVGSAYAFSPVQNGEINKPASEEAKKAVNEAFTKNDRLNNAIYFYNPEIATDDWIRSREIVKTIDNHVFAL